MTDRICICCGGENDRDLRSHTGLCSTCSRTHFDEGVRASARLAYAIRKGRVSPARDSNCTDCGRPARINDHRDYTKPLDVQPVCCACNQKRGPAFNSIYRPAHERAAV